MVDWTCDLVCSNLSACASEAAAYPEYQTSIIDQHAAGRCNHQMHCVRCASLLDQHTLNLILHDLSLNQGRVFPSSFILVQCERHRSPSLDS